MDKLVEENYLDEVFGYQLYSNLAIKENNPKVREILEELAEGEKRHSEFWRMIASKKNVSLKSLTFWLKFKLLLLLFLRKIIGIALTLKIAEYGEISDAEKYDKLSRMDIFSDTEKEEINKIKMEELYHEDLLVQTQINIDKIRDAIYAISDGLIEVLAGVSGLSGVFNTPILVALGGLIIGISGTISMSIGAYLSSQSETDIEKSSLRKLGKTSQDSQKPKESVTTTAVSYIIGALIPVLPFLIGLSGIVGIIVAYAATGLATFVVGNIIGLLSNVNPTKKGLQMTVLAIAAALVTHAIGSLFHIIE